MQRQEGTFADHEHCLQQLGALLHGGGMLQTKAELLVTGNRRDTRQGTIETLLTAVRDHIQGFKHIHVRFRPDNPYGHIAQITCRCDPDGRRICPHPCAAESDRPCLSLVLREASDGEWLLGGAGSPPV